MSSCERNEDVLDGDLLRVRDAAGGAVSNRDFESVCLRESRIDGLVGSLEVEAARARDGENVKAVGRVLGRSRLGVDACLGNGEMADRCSEVSLRDALCCLMRVGALGESEACSL